MPPPPGDFYAAPDASGNGNGSLNSPFTLQQAATSTAILATSTVYLRGGNYPAITSDLAFGRDVTYKPYPGEHPVIQVDTGNINVVANNVAFEGTIEITGVNAQRVSLQSGSAPNDIPTNGLNIIGANCKLKGLLIHDLKGLFFAHSAPGWLVENCDIGEIGWQGADRGHGHCIYAQAQGTIINTVLRPSFGDALNFYSQSQNLIGLHVDGLISFDDVAGVFGGEAATTVDDVIAQNSTYWNSAPDCGYLSGTKGSLTLLNNYYALANALIRAGWASVTNTGNVSASGGANVVKVYPGTYAHHVCFFNWEQLSSVTVDVSSLNLVQGNTYRLRQLYDPMNDTSTFVYNGGNLTLPFTGRTVATPFGYSGPLAVLDPRWGTWRIEPV